MLIQFILIIAILFIIIRSWYRKQKKEISSGEFFVWLAIWVVAIIVIAWPDITSLIASAVGVKRGVDLVVYVSIIFIFYLLFRLLMRIEKIEKDITHLTRAIALKQTDKNNHDQQ
ncbi:MAG: DUF2304 family protein [bacterium]